MKKIIIVSLLIIALLVIAGGVFWYWQSQKDVRELNKTLSKGVFAAKSLWGNEYKVVNKIDGYEFKVPEAWEGIEKVEYIPKISEENYPVTSTNVKGLAGPARFVAIDRFETEGNPDIKSFAETIFNEYGLSGDFISDKINGINLIKTQENVHLGGMYVYFFKKDLLIYAVTNGSEEFIKEIILNGEW